jgi:hypothetical protein
MLFNNVYRVSVDNVAGLGTRKSNFILSGEHEYEYIYENI